MRVVTALYHSHSDQISELYLINCSVTYSFNLRVHLLMPSSITFFAVQLFSKVLRLKTLPKLNKIHNYFSCYWGSVT